MPTFTTVARADEIPEGQGRTFRLGEQMIAVFHVAGRYYALDDYCPHMGSSLGSGEVCGEMVICDRHRWAFSLLDGHSRDAPSLTARTFEVRMEGEEIQVEVG
jgi:nitrite reductase/ring-hydroxylating ferredoxin subunit